MIWKILVLILAGAFMAATVIWLGRQMILFLEEIMTDLEKSETKGDNNE